MTRFRFFTLDSTGRIDRGLERDYPHEADAIRFAERLTDADSVEVWRHHTLVAKLFPYGNAGSPKMSRKSRVTSPYSFR